MTASLPSNPVSSDDSITLSPARVEVERSCGTTVPEVGMLSDVDAASAPAGRQTISLLALRLERSDALDLEREQRWRRSMTAEIERASGSFGARVEISPDGTLLVLFAPPVVQTDPSLSAIRAAERCREVLNAAAVEDPLHWVGVVL